MGGKTSVPASGRHRGGITSPQESWQPSDSVISDPVPSARPPDTEILQEFRTKLNSLPLSEDQKLILQEQAVDVKYKLLCKLKEIQPEVEGRGPAHMARLIQDNPTLRSFKQLFRWLKSAPDADVSAFIESQGIDLLVNMLLVTQELSKNTGNSDKETAILKCLAHLNTFEEGTADLLNDEMKVVYLVLSLSPEDEEASLCAIDLMIDLCWYSTEGYEAVAKAIEVLALDKGLSSPFHFFLDVLRSPSSSYAFKHKAMAFINTLVQSPLEIETQTSTRGRLIALGLKEMLNTLKEQISAIGPVRKRNIRAFQLETKRRRLGTKESKPKDEVSSKSKRSNILVFDPDNVDDLLDTRERLRSEHKLIKPSEEQALDFKVNEIIHSTIDIRAISAFVEKQGDGETDGEEGEDEDYALALIDQIQLFEEAEEDQEINIEVPDGALTPETILRALEKSAKDANASDILLEILTSLLSIPPDPDSGKPLWASLKSTMEILCKKLDFPQKIADAEIEKILEEQREKVEKIRLLENLQKMLEDRDREIDDLWKEKKDFLEKKEMAKRVIREKEEELEKVKMAFDERKNRLETIEKELEERKTVRKTGDQVGEISPLAPVPSAILPPQIAVEHVLSLQRTLMMDIKGVIPAPIPSLSPQSVVHINQGQSPEIPLAPSLNLPSIQKPGAPIVQIPNPSMVNEPGRLQDRTVIEEELKVENPSQVPNAPQLNIPGVNIPIAPQLNLPNLSKPGIIPIAPVLSIPTAPQLSLPNLQKVGVVPTAPILSIPTAPQLSLPNLQKSGVSTLPVQNVPAAPQLNLPNVGNKAGDAPTAPVLSIPTAPQLTIPTAPQLNLSISQQKPGVPTAPQLSIPTAPQLNIPNLSKPGVVPTAPQLTLPNLQKVGVVPTAPVLSIPTAPQLTLPNLQKVGVVPTAPVLSIPTAPQLTLPNLQKVGVVPTAPVLSIPTAPQLTLPNLQKVGVVPTAPVLSIPTAPQLTLPNLQKVGVVPTAPVLSIPTAPQLTLPNLQKVGVVPTAPVLSIPTAPQLTLPNLQKVGVVPTAPVLSIPTAPQLTLPNLQKPGVSTLPGQNVPAAPQLNLPNVGNKAGVVPTAPVLSIPTAPQINIPNLQKSGVPSAPVLNIAGLQKSGIPSAPSLNIPLGSQSGPQVTIPTAPNLGIPSAPVLGIPNAPKLGTPIAPSLGILSNPKSGIPSAPQLGVVSSPSLSGLIQAALPPKEKRKPATAMKSLFWTPITAAPKITNSVWKELDDSKIKLDEESLISLFAQKKTPQKEGTSGESAHTSTEQKSTKISLYPKERSQNVQLLLGKLRMSNAAIVEALLQIDETVLTRGNLVTLR